MNFLKLALIILALGFSAQANAGLLLEPYIGYGGIAGDASSTGTAAGSVSATGTGVAYGGRVGLTIPFVFFAADYTSIGGSTALTGTIGGVSVSKSTDFTETALGADVGLNLPFIRVWAGYNFSVNSKINGTDYTGTGMRAGLGLGFIPFISINLEYMNTTYASQTSAGTTTTPSDHVIFGAVSIPFDL
jgi:hypothetical protein